MDYDKMNVFVAIFLFSAARGIFVRSETGDTCEDKNGKSGTCTPLVQCASAIDDIKNKGQHPKICAFEGIDPIVCCIDTSKASNVLPENSDAKQPSYNSTQTNISNSTSTRVPVEISRAKCKEYTKYSYRNVVLPVLTVIPQYTRIYDCKVGAEVLITDTITAGRQEFPHMAHIGYSTDKKGGKIYMCGGTLISENFVLTAAHCLYSRAYGYPIEVRLGVTNVNDTSYRQIKKIKEVLPHPDYSVDSYYHDIGLIRLEDEVEITPYVRPACLNVVRNITTVQTGIVTGWGLSSFTGMPSEDLSRSILGISSFEKCKSTYQVLIKIKMGIVDDWMICAAITNKQRKGACQGDSGSPLQIKLKGSEEVQCMYNVIGVTSFGKLCGLLETPGVYTRVSNYIKWIEDTVWPENGVN